MTQSSRPRGSKDIWLNAAYELLISEGIEAVKVMPLAKKLNLSRTGFYWFFADIEELRRAMAERWERKNTETLVDRCGADAGNICEALFNLMDCWLDPKLFDAPLDLAIRNWARIDNDLEKRLDKADSLRIKAVADMFTRHGYSKDQADVRGMTVIYTQIGYISMRVSENKMQRLSRVKYYVELFAGVKPTQQNIDNFIKRH